MSFYSILNLLSNDALGPNAITKRLFITIT